MATVTDGRLMGVTVGLAGPTTPGSSVCTVVKLPETEPWLETCGEALVKGSLILTWNMMTICSPGGMVPRATLLRLSLSCGEGVRVIFWLPCEAPLAWMPCEAEVVPEGSLTGWAGAFQTGVSRTMKPAC